MRLTIIYDNESRNEKLKADWGFSCLIESDGINLLFDTGTSGALLMEHMKVIGIDPQSIDEVFISHIHFDHAGGLATFLNANGNVTVYAPSPVRGIRPAREVVYINEPMWLNEHFYTTGLLGSEELSPDFQNMMGLMEQSLAIQTEKGLVVVAGCSHPGVGNILDAVKTVGTPYALIGGLHGFDDFDVLKDLSVICPTHCTQHIAEIESLYPGEFVRGGVGEILEI
ncbi:MAG: MBL fold metallo-hydrolase [Candidatus Zixiibacteriota bacterium]|nr:MAG: MBL fold metallo-hydrolase [candidate division Zixibacteria bacterium]